jgi:hypothetical protein
MTATQEQLDKLEFRTYRDHGVDILATLDVDNWLADRVSENEELQAEFDNWLEANGKDDAYYSALEFATDVKRGSGLYGEDAPMVINTYHREDILSSILQYVYWEDDDGAHILLEKHRGGDPRGNYAPIVAMDCDGNCDETAIFDNAQGIIFCNDCEKSWYTDDGSLWYPEGVCGGGHLNLEDYPATDTRPEYPEKLDPNQQTFWPPADLQVTRSSGELWVDDDGNGHCPYCGGILSLSAF